MREEILFEWNPWWSGEFETGAVDRKVLDSIGKWLERPEIIALTGVRRSGKTTLLHMTVEELLGEVPAENILFVKCDDERVDEDNVIEAAREKHRELFDTDEGTYLLLDEVQYQDGWMDAVKRIYDLEKEEKILVTGSRVLKEELSTALAGRFARFDVYPFSFREFLDARGIEMEREQDVFSQSDTLKHLLRKYLEWGGFPEIVLEGDEELKRELLQFYADTILYRDVVERTGIQRTGAVEQLKTYALANMTSPANYSTIAENLNVAGDTVSSYLEAMEDAFFIFTVPVFAYSVKKQHRNPKKLYCVDTGIRNAAGFRFTDDIGKLYENAVFVELKRRGHDPYYWKGNGKEVDFVVHEGQEVKELIQVTYDFEAAEQREFEAIEAGIEELDPDRAFILTRDTRKTIESSGAEVRVLPLREWLVTPLHSD